MKLLFDSNLSYRLVKAVSDLYPDSMHVQRLQLGTASDKAIFDYAKVKGYAIVSRDIDFYHLSAFYGAPPKVIRIEVGNASSQLVKQILRDRYEEIIQFLRDLEESYLLLR